MRGERGLLFCEDNQSCFSRFSCLVLFPLNLGPALLQSSGDLGSTLIAQAALAAFFAGAFVTLAVLATVALAFGATASPFKHKTRAFCKAMMPRSISASSCFALIQNPPL
jgi:hypothetical protein